MPKVLVPSEDLAALKQSLKELKDGFDLKASEVELLKAHIGKPVSATGLTPGKVFATAVDHNSIEERRFGYKSFSEYLVDVKEAGMPNGKRPERLYKAVSGLSEGTAADGGFLVPPEFSNQIFTRVYENDLIKRISSFTVAGNTMAFPAIDETSRVDGSRFGAISSAWLDEAQQIPSSKPKYRRLVLNLKKLGCLAYVTEELMTDASVAMDQYLTKLFAMELEFKVGDAIVNGTGGGQPWGILNSPALIVVSKETGQAAKTIVTENITKVWSRMWNGSRGNCVWLVNQDTLPQLHTMTLGVGTGGVVTYMPPGGLSGQPYATIYGRPVLEIEFAQTLGTQGDIILADLSQWYSISKGGVSSETSIHLRFDFDELAFRVLHRIDGGSIWHSALTPKNGTNTQSPWVTLATRS